MNFSVYYLWNDDESCKTGSENEIDPKDPSKKSEVRGDGGPKKRFDLFDPSLPRDEERNYILRLSRYHLYRLRVNIFSFLNSTYNISFHRLIKSAIVHFSMSHQSNLNCNTSCEINETCMLEAFPLIYKKVYLHLYNFFNR